MRYNLFNEVYKSLKLSLLNSCMSLSNIADNGVTLDLETITKMKNTLRLAKEQVAHEATNILPLIFEYEPGIWDALTKEHHKVLNLQSSLDLQLKCFSNVTTNLEKAGLIISIKTAFNEFVKYNYNHMDDEEAIINDILWRYYKDESLKEIFQHNNAIHSIIGKTNPKYRTATAA